MIPLEKIKIKEQIVIYLLLLGFISCADQVDTNQYTEGKARINFSLLPGQMQTRTDAGAINTLQVLIFEEEIENSNTYNYRETIYPTSQGGAYTIEIDSPTGNRLKLYLLANSTLDGITIDETDTFDDIKTKLITTFHENTQPDYLPMYGESGVITGLVNQAVIEAGIIELLRSVATFEITKKAETVTNFELFTVQVFRANKQVQLIPNSYETDAENNNKKYVTTASVPVNSEKYNSAIIGNENQLVNSLSGLYLPESEAKTGDAQTTQATCLVIGGTYDGSNTITYYRVDIKNINGGNFGQILRNTQYNILITKVEENGYNTAEEAANNPAGSMDVNIIEINDGGGEVIVDADGNMLMLNDNPIRVGYYAGATASSLVGTTADTYTVQWFTADFSGSNQTIQWKKGVENNDVLEGRYFDIRIISREDIIDPSYTYSALQITAKELYTGEERLERDEYGIISIGDLNLKFNIIQKSRDTYEYNFIDIFSYTELGCTLGDEIMFTEAVMGSIAEVLVNTIKNESMFGPAGTVPVGGFDISGLPSSSSFMTPRLADIFDVIFLPEGTEWVSQDSDELFGVIWDWLNMYTNKVLITAMDNAVLADIFPFTMGMIGDEWWSEPASSTGNYEVSADAPGFIRKGPFGSVNAGGEIASSPNAWGITSSKIIYADENPSITPILTIQGQPNEIVLGVDQANRIIYYGNQNCFLSSSQTFSQTNSLSTQADILLANLFAWIAETVIGEKLAPDVE